MAVYGNGDISSGIFWLSGLGGLVSHLVFKMMEETQAKAGDYNGEMGACPRCQSENSWTIEQTVEDGRLIEDLHCLYCGELRPDCRSGVRIIDPVPKLIGHGVCEVCGITFEIFRAPNLRGPKRKRFCGGVECRRAWKKILNERRYARKAIIS